MSRLRDTPPLTIDPGRQSGRVCINGTRCPAESVAWSVWAERGANSNATAAESAEDYGCSRNEALLACWWLVSEGHLTLITGQRKRKRQWEAWADHALRVFGGWDKRVRTLCDPDDYEVPS